jgi:hypothetical protein
MYEISWVRWWISTYRRRACACSLGIFTLLHTSRMMVEDLSGFSYLKTPHNFVIPKWKRREKNFAFCSRTISPSIYNYSLSHLTWYLKTSGWKPRLLYMPVTVFDTCFRMCLNVKTVWPVCSRKLCSGAVLDCFQTRHTVAGHAASSDCKYISMNTSVHTSISVSHDQDTVAQVSLPRQWPRH